jgi:NAD+ kinase
MASKVWLSRDLYNFAAEKGYDVSLMQYFENHTDMPDADYFLSIGGDGTMLEAVTYITDKNIPILGINTGRLGFLATNSKDEYAVALRAMFDGYFDIEERSMICLDSNQDLFGGVPLALNEFAIMKRDTSSMIVVHTYINGEYLNSYWADGLIVATPTGSTGYSLSVGGPVLVPQTANFVIAPVSPHNLNVRPLIVPDSSVIAFEIEGRSKNFLVSLDSRSRKVDANIQLAVRSYEHKAKLIKLSGQSFLKTLRTKLNWGMDIRNYPGSGED